VQIGRDDSEDEDGSGTGGSDGDDDDEEAGGGTAGNKQQQPAANKGASFARAFAKILQRPVRGIDGSRGAAAPVAAADAGNAVVPSGVELRGATGDAAILAVGVTVNDSESYN
jgi:hypothetical protein